MRHFATDGEGRYVGYDEQRKEWVEVDNAFVRRTLTQQEQVAQENRQQAEDVGMVDAGLIGAGKAFVDLGRGAQDLWYRATGQDEARRDLQRRMEEEGRIYSELQKQHPIMTSLGESVPYMAAGGLAGVGRALPSALLRQGAAGGAVGGTMYSPTMEGRMRQAGIDAALGIAGEGIGRGIGRVINPGMSPASPGVQRVIQEAEQVGLQATPATKTGSQKMRQIVEGGLESTITGAPAIQRIGERNQSVLNRMAAEAVGEDADALTDVVIDRARRRMGKVYNELFEESDYIFELGDDFNRLLDKIEVQRVSPYISGPEDPIMQAIRRAREVAEKHDGFITAKDLHHQQSRLGRDSWAQRTLNPELSGALRDIRNLFLNLAEEQSTPENAKLIRDTRSQYRNLENLMPALDSVSGNVSAAKLASRLAKKDPTGYTQGRNRSPLYTGARFMGDKDVQPVLRSSQTPERQYIANTLAHGGLGMGAFTIDPMAASFVFGAPYVASKAYASPRAGNWFLRQPNPTVQNVLGMGGIGAMQMMQ